MHKIYFFSAFSFICLLSLLPMSLAQSQKPVFNAQSFTLKNGMKAVLIENNRAPVVTHMVWYDVGAADEDFGQSGLAHYLEHLMFKGTEKLEPGEFSKRVQQMGGQDNAFTSQDYTAYFQTISTDNLEEVMRMEADRMLNLNVPEEEVESERSVVLEERAQRLENNPQAQFFSDLRHALYINHPYATPIIGWRDDIEKLDKAKADAFYKKWYKPAQATLIVAGDVDFKTFKKLAHKIYGKLPDIDETPRQDFSHIAELNANKSIDMAHELVRQPIYARLYRAPSFAQNKQDSTALEVLEEYLDGSESSPFYQELVVNQKIASNINFSYSEYAKGPSSVSISAYPSPGVGIEKLADETMTLLESIAKNPPSAEELNIVKTRMQDSAIFSRDSLSGPAFLIGRALASDVSLDDIENWPSLVDRVEVKDIVRVLNTYILNKDLHYVEGTLTPEEQEKS